MQISSMIIGNLKVMLHFYGYKVNARVIWHLGFSLLWIQKVESALKGKSTGKSYIKIFSVLR